MGYCVGGRLRQEDLELKATQAQKPKKGAREMAQWSGGALAAPAEDLVPSIHIRQLTTACNFQ